MWRSEHGWKDYDEETCVVLEAFYSELIAKGWDGSSRAEILLDHGFYGHQGVSLS